MKVRHQNEYRSTTDDDEVSQALASPFKYPLHWHELRRNGSFFTRAGPKLSFVIDGFDVSIPSTNEVLQSHLHGKLRKIVVVPVEIVVRHIWMVACAFVVTGGRGICKSVTPTVIFMGGGANSNAERCRDMR